MDYSEEFDRLIQSVSVALGKPIDRSKYQIVDRGLPHIQPKSNELKDKMAVYTFLYKDKFLKIGKAGPNSHARFVYHHYHFTEKGARSTLTKFLMDDKSSKCFGKDQNEVGKWIKENCRRIDIMFDMILGVFTLELVEAILHFVFNPKYEGYNSQR